MLNFFKCCIIINFFIHNYHSFKSNIEHVFCIVDKKGQIFNIQPLFSSTKFDFFLVQKTSICIGSPRLIFFCISSMVRNLGLNFFIIFLLFVFKKSFCNFLNSERALSSCSHSFPLPYGFQTEPCSSFLIPFFSYQSNFSFSISKSVFEIFRKLTITRIKQNGT